MTKNEALRAGLYARVSSEQQARENTIGSQVEALRERIKEDGLPITPPVWAASGAGPGQRPSPTARPTAKRELRSIPRGRREPENRVKRITESPRLVPEIQA